MGRNVCGLCNAKREDTVSLHRFPKNEVNCMQWKKACRYEENDNVANVYLCSNHFLKTDFLNEITPNCVRRKLLQNAIPTQNLSGKYIRKVIVVQPFNQNQDVEVKPEVISLPVVKPLITPKIDALTRDNVPKDNLPKTVTTMTCSCKDSSPCRAERALLHERYLNNAHLKKIKVLQQKIRRLKKKIETSDRLVKSKLKR